MPLVAIVFRDNAKTTKHSHRGARYVAGLVDLIEFGQQLRREYEAVGVDLDSTDTFVAHGSLTREPPQPIVALVPTHAGVEFVSRKEFHELRKDHLSRQHASSPYRPGPRRTGAIVTSGVEIVRAPDSTQRQD